MNSRDQFFARIRNALNAVNDSDTDDSRMANSTVTSPKGNMSERPDRLKNFDFRINRFKDVLISQKTEIIDYPDDFDKQKKIWKTLLRGGDVLHKVVYSSKSWFHPPLSEAINDLQSDPNYAAKSKVFYADQETGYLDTQVDKFSFLEFDVGITEVEAGLADTGSLLLIPSRDEPRALSLVPPIHIAVMSQKRVMSDLSDFFKSRSFNLSDNSDNPSNVVLISGPSKTADIEKRLVHGVHGPRRLILLLSK